MTQAALQNLSYADSTAPEREAGLMTSTGVQGVGKTYQNMGVIARYVKDKLDIKVRGRKVLIFDTNGEYTQEEFLKNGHQVAIKTIALSDVRAFAKSDLVEIRRIDAKHLGIPEKKAILDFLVRNWKNGLLVLEDINTYVLNILAMENVVGKIISLRHKAIDCLISYQSLRAVEPRIWQNSRWVRMHFQADDVDDIKGKVTNPELYKIAQLMVNHRYLNATKQNMGERFFVYITKFGRKLEGGFGKDEFMFACKGYLNLNKKKVTDFMSINEISQQEATKKLQDFYYRIYYDNPDRVEAA
ncbi:MAG: hypothetical protein V4547_18000 [Bacteroidota bacterium]